MDNVVFNVKGETNEDLLNALKLAFSVSEVSVARGFKIDKKKGLLLYQYNSSDCNPFITGMTAEQVFTNVLAFLEGDDAKSIELTGWDKKLNDFEVMDYLGWRVYTEDWGQIKDNEDAFLAITPAFCWSGK